MKPCKHPHWYRRSIIAEAQPDAPVSAKEMLPVEHDECGRCGSWLSLGPSNDEPEAVRIEIAAAARSVGDPVPRSLGVRCHDDPEDSCLACAVMWLQHAIERHRDSAWSVEA